MKSDLKWDGIVIRSQQKAKSNSRGANVDIIGNRNDNRGNTLVRLAYLYMICMVALAMVGLYYDENWVLIIAFITGKTG